MNLSTHNKAIIALIIANIIWGAAAPVFKWSLQNIEPFTLAFLRYAVAALILLPLTFKALKVERRDLSALFLLSIFGITINISLFSLGLQLTSSINVPIIGASAPIFIILSSILFLHEKPKTKVIVGTILSLVGIITIIARPFFEQELSGSIIGNLLILGAVFGAVVYTTLLRKIAKKYSVMTLTFWSFVIGALTFLPMFVAENKDQLFLATLNHQGVVGIIFGAVLSSVIAYCFYNFALKNIVANEVGIFFYLDPVVAVVIAIPLLGEVITIPYLFGSLLVFLGLFIAEGHFPYHPSLKLRSGKPSS